MPLRWLLRRSVQKAARAQAGETIRRAAASAVPAGRALPAPGEHRDDAPCRAAILFDLPVQVEAFVAKLQGVVTNRAPGLDVHIGGLAGRQIAAAVGGEKPHQPHRMIETVVAGHRPDVVVAAGQVCGLTESLGVGDIVVADELTNDRGGQLAIPLQAAPTARVHVGRIVTIAALPHEPAAKRELARRTGAVAADSVSFAFGEACRREGVPFMAVRVLTQAVDEAIDREVVHLLAQKTVVAKTGAFTGALWRRPGSIKELWRLKERSFETSDRLAAFLVSVLGQ